MKSFRTISAIFFCLLVIFSSTSFMVGIHFCGGKAQDISFFSPADRCMNEKQIPPCHSHQTKRCCEDESIFHEGQELKTDIAKIQFSATWIAIDLAQPSILIAEVIPASRLAKIKFFNYDTPLRSYDLTIEHQVFLI